MQGLPYKPVQRRRYAQRAFTANDSGGRDCVRIGGSFRFPARCPKSVEVDAAGNAYVADRNNSRIRRIDPDGRVYISEFGGNRVRVFTLTNPCP